MSQNASLKNVLENQDKTFIYQKKVSIRNGLLILGLGALVIIISRIPLINSINYMPYFLLTTASILIITGILKISMRKKIFISPIHGKLIEKTIGFDILEKDKLIKMLESRQAEDIKRLKRSVTESLVLRILLTTNCQICFSQVEHFANLEYEAVNEVHQHKYEEALALKLLK